jgi:hypothetical protein
MIKTMSNTANSSAGLEQAIMDVIKSIATEESALSAILNLEGAILQKAKNITGNIDEFVAVNESVNRLIQNATRLQMLMQINLQYAEEILQQIDDYDEQDELEE